MPANVVPPDLRDFLRLAPVVVLAFWGLVVIAADLARFRRLEPEARRLACGRAALVGVGLALAASALLVWVDVLALSNPSRLVAAFGDSLGGYLARGDAPVFFGTVGRGLAADVLDVVFMVLLAMVVWMSTAYRFTDDLGEYFALMLWATVGMMLLAAAEELATLFVALETTTLCLYLATAIERSRRRSAEAGLKFFLYGSVSSALFLYGLSLVYGLAGSTYFDAIGRTLNGGGAGLAGDMAGAAAVLLVLVGFGFKVASAPFQQWAPDVYEGAPAPVAAWIASGSKVAGFVAMLKVFIHALGPWSHPSMSVMGPGWLGLLAVVAAATMTYGNLAALAQRDYKRMLAYSSIAHAGYLLVGVAAVSVSTDGPTSAGATLYYLIVYALANVGAFAAAAWLARDKGTEAIADLNGLARRSPLLALCVTALMLSLIGVPPFAGFFAKLYVFMEALRQGPAEARIVLAWLVALGFFNSVVSAFYYFRVMKAMYLREPAGRPLEPARSAVGLPIVATAVLVTALGVASEPLARLCRTIAAPMLAAGSAEKPSGVAWRPQPPTD